MFDLTIRYKVDKINIVFDVLSRLQTSITIIKNKLNVLKTLYKQSIHDFEKPFILSNVLHIEISVNYHIILIKMLINFKSRLIVEYIKNL